MIQKVIHPIKPLYNHMQSIFETLKVVMENEL